MSNLERALTDKLCFPCDCVEQRIVWERKLGIARQVEGLEVDAHNAVQKLVEINLLTIGLFQKANRSCPLEEYESLDRLLTMYSANIDNVFESMCHVAYFETCLVEPVFPKMSVKGGLHD